MNYKATSEKIVECIGMDNIISYTHCATRLRFTLKSNEAVDEKTLNEMPEIMKIVNMSGMYQLVIGPDVENLYDEIAKIIPADKAAPVIEVNEDASKNEPKGLNKIFKVIVSCVAPTLPAMVATGLVKGALALCSYFGVLDTTSGAYLVFNALSDSLFYFFPIIVGYNCGKEFKCDPIVTAVIGGSLVYPSIVSAFNEYSAGTATFTFFGIPLVLKSYVSSLLPVIAASWMASKIEHFLKKRIPSALKMLVVPFTTLVITVPLTFLAVGPVITLFSDLVCNAILAVWDFAPALASGLVGAFWGLLVLSGMHYGLLPAIMGIYLSYGYDPMGPSVMAYNFSLIGLSMAFMILTKNREEKSTSLAAALSSFAGITEPALYSVALKYKECLYSMFIGGGVAGIVAGILDARVFGTGPNPLAQFALTFSEEGFTYALKWIATEFTAFAVAFLCAYLLLKHRKKKEMV